MSADDNAAPTLQFDTAIPQATPAARASSMGCAACRREMSDRYFDVNGQTVCEACSQGLAAEIQTPQGWGAIARAGLFGGVAAIAGAILYYAVIRITDFEIGLVAIAIGYMVGYAIRMAVGGRGGRRFQILAVVLTYWAVGLAYAPLVFESALKAGQAASDSTESAPATRTGPTAADASARAADTPDTGVVAAILMLVGLTFALPVMVTIGSIPGGLISAAIIAFGMRQAWHMTGAPRLAITGPYRIGPAPA
jgi:hypothetical protein